MAVDTVASVTPEPKKTNAWHTVLAGFFLTAIPAWIGYTLVTQQWILFGLSVGILGYLTFVGFKSARETKAKAPAKEKEKLDLEITRMTHRINAHRCEEIDAKEEAEDRRKNPDKYR